MVRRAAANPRRTSLVALERRRARLNRLLSKTRAEDFFALIWATDALQEGRADAARRVIRNFPPDAVSPAINSSFAIQRWELDTLVTAYLQSPVAISQKAVQRIIDVSHFDTVVELVNALRGLEEAESGREISTENVIAEMSRIGHRQFHWQLGYLHKSNFFRSHFLYGQGACAAYLVRQHGITPNELSIIGFAIYAASDERQWLSPGRNDLRALNIGPETIEAGLRLLAAPAAELATMAKRNYTKHRPLAYQASALRERPVVSLQHGMIVPIRELLLRRITIGLYYDLVGAGGAILSEIGERFELFSYKLLAALLSTFLVRTQYTYGPAARLINTPDILLSRNSCCEIIVECKTTKMPIAAMYSLNPSEEAIRQMRELSKGVFQIWRFCSHARRQLIAEVIAPEAVGLLLTIDDWALVAVGNYKTILEGAVRLADEAGEIETVDRVPVAISSIVDVELTLTEGTDNGFGPTLLRATEEDYFGWALPSLQSHIGLKAPTRKAYPFADRLGEVLPWWDQIGQVGR